VTPLGGKSFLPVHNFHPWGYPLSGSDNMSEKSQWQLFTASCDPKYLQQAFEAVSADYEARLGLRRCDQTWLVNKGHYRWQLIEDVRRHWANFARRIRGHFPYSDTAVTYAWLMFHKQPGKEVDYSASVDPGAYDDAPALPRERRAALADNEANGEATSDKRKDTLRRCRPRRAKPREDWPASPPVSPVGRPSVC